MNKETSSIGTFLLVLVIGVSTIKLYVDVRDTRKDIAKIRRNYLKYETARKRASFVDWQISELGMTCGDAISIANAAYDMVSPTINTEYEEYTTEQLDSIINASDAKAYAIRWAEISLAKRYEEKNESGNSKPKRINGPDQTSDTNVYLRR